MNHKSSNALVNAYNSIANMKEDFISFMILIFILIIILIVIAYFIYLSKLQVSECNFMSDLYGTLDGKIRSINQGDEQCTYNFNEYYIKTAYNSCSGGSYKNDFVNICNLKNLIKQGVRGLDFELYSIGDSPVVSTSTSDNYYIKETYNYVNFADVMSTIENYAFSGGTAPNSTDPIIIHLRIKSNNQAMYTNLANIFKAYDNRMLGKDYSFENYGHNIGNEPLLSFVNKIILIVDRINGSFLDNKEFLEYVNLTSNSIFMRGYSYYDIKNNPDINELQQYNKRSMTIVFPDNGENQVNPSGYLVRDTGSQMLAMRFQYIDNFLEENTLFFDQGGYAFILKPERLRYVPVTIPKPTPQDPALSYQTRDVGTDYYNFKY